MSEDTNQCPSHVEEIHIYSGNEAEKKHKNLQKIEKLHHQMFFLDKWLKYKIVINEFSVDALLD